MTKDALPSALDDLSASADASAPAAHSADAVDTLKAAMRRARADNAERAGVTTDLRAARLGRLELLREALKPLVAQIPADADMFDIGVLPSANPRLFVDMIGFVEMGRDTRLYRLLQDTRTGRLVLRESEDVGTMVEAITDYVARRLLERERALAADTPPAAATLQATRPARERPPRPRRSMEPHATQRPNRRASLLAVAFSFLVDLLGSIALFTGLAIGLWYAWTKLHGAP